jgi:hypothetical protein
VFKSSILLLFATLLVLFAHPQRLSYAADTDPKPTTYVTPPSSVAFGGSDAANELWAAQAQYDKQKKNPLVSFALELALPSAGNFYAGETEDAVLTITGLAIGGVFLADGYGLLCQAFKGDTAHCPHKIVSQVQGWVFLIGTRLFGLANAPSNVVRNNRALRARLGLDEAEIVCILPWVGPNETGMQLAFRY